MSEDDLAAAMERTHAYVKQARQAEPRVSPIAAGRAAVGERVQNADTRLENGDSGAAREAVSA